MSRAPRGAGPESCGTPCARSFFNSCGSLPRRHSDAKSVVVTLPRWLTEGASQFSDDGPGVKRRGFSLGQTNSGPSGAHWGRLTANGPLGLNGAKRLSLNHCCVVKPGTPLAARLSERLSQGRLLPHGSARESLLYSQSRSSPLEFSRGLIELLPVIADTAD